MKFTVLDARVDDGYAHYTDTYTYLDDLLDKTFLTDYFLDHNIPVNADGSKSPNTASNK